MLYLVNSRGLFVFKERTIMSKLMNSTGNIVDIFNLQKEQVCKEVIILGACRINRCATC